jgi:hypothetical protein
MHGIDVFDATIVAASRNDCVVVEIRAAEQSLFPADDCGRLFSIGNWFDRAFERFRIDAGGVGYHFCTHSASVSTAAKNAARTSGKPPRIPDPG